MKKYKNAIKISEPVSLRDRFFLLITLDHTSQRLFIIVIQRCFFSVNFLNLPCYSFFISMDSIIDQLTAFLFTVKIIP